MNLYARYQSNAVETSNQIQQLTMVLDKTISILYTAIKSRESGDNDAEFMHLTKAVDIFYLMGGSIDFASSSEIVKQLCAFFIKTADKIAYINGNIASIDEIKEVINTIISVRDALTTATNNETQASDAKTEYEIIPV